MSLEHIYDTVTHDFRRAGAGRPPSPRADLVSAVLAALLRHPPRSGLIHAE